ncbi:MAG: MlaD family protein [Planctomycetes bacterium]|nr:MlaD family protein [Planctomycetota bacterium]
MKAPPAWLPFALGGAMMLAGLSLAAFIIATRDERTEPRGQPLSNGARVEGSASAPAGVDLAPLPAPCPGDLTISVHLAHSRGLERGDPVRYRGVEVGLVTRVGLSEENDCVIAEAYIRRDVRKTVTLHTHFWVEPATHAGVSLSFRTPSDNPSVPAHDGEVFIAAVAPPLEEDESYAGGSGALAGRARDPRLGQSLVLVHSLLGRAADQPEDPTMPLGITQVSPGIFYRTRDGAGVVVAARSGIDLGWAREREAGVLAGYEEFVRVEFEDGSVRPAREVWHADARRDLALVAVDSPPRIAAAPPLDFRVDVPAESGGIDVELLAYTQAHRLETKSARFLEDGRLDVAADGWARGIIIREGTAIGFAGKSREDLRTPCAFLLNAVPEHLRPEAP